MVEGRGFAVAAVVFDGDFSWSRRLALLVQFIVSVLVILHVQSRVAADECVDLSLSRFLLLLGSLQFVMNVVNVSVQLIARVELRFALETDLRCGDCTTVGSLTLQELLP